MDLVVSEEGSKVLLSRLREDREVAPADHLLAPSRSFSLSLGRSPPCRISFYTSQFYYTIHVSFYYTMHV